MPKTTHADPMKTKTGKTRLGPLSLTQLRELLEKSSRPKDKAKMVRRLNHMVKRFGYSITTDTTEV
mgnify:CR=1 FL=1